jgi:hypothetical protein
MDATYIFFGGRHQRVPAAVKLLIAGTDVPILRLPGLSSLSEMKIPPDILQVPESNGGGGRTRTYDLRIMRPSL